ncbi:hypothetical protein GTW52_03740 [Streptomyces sp. SID8358]|uniref:protein phosphatase 2C domain-containing protein n=1 Tax=Streptomyces sp. SID8358 TaxID=2690342 RepID=UPI000DAD2CCD|nr:protein phosphatase 2C domain-containing protein [Streptomyces sp. SID8358]MYU32244.1 hypothetical protein [Streptomyces sp. SID8358]
MSQQGEKPAAHEDDWWRRLYDEAAPDTGPAGAPDSLDDRFDSASDAVGPTPDADAEQGRGLGPDAVRADPPDHPGTVVPVPDPRTAPAAAHVPPPPRPAAPARPEPEAGPATGGRQVPPPTDRAAATSDVRNPAPAARQGGPDRCTHEPATAPGLRAAPVPPSVSPPPAPEPPPEGDDSGAPASAAEAAPPEPVRRAAPDGPARLGPEDRTIPDGPGWRGTADRPSPAPSADPVPPPAGAAWDVPPGTPAPDGAPPESGVPVPGRHPGAAGPVAPPAPERPEPPETFAAPPTTEPPRTPVEPSRPEPPSRPPAATWVPPPAPGPSSAPPPAGDPRSTSGSAEPAPSRATRPQVIVVRPPWEAPGTPESPPARRTFAVPLAPRPPQEPEASAQSSEAPADVARGGPRPVVGHLGDRPPTYDAEPAALPASGVDDLDGLVPDTVLDGARYGTYTLRAASVRGDSARFRGEPRRDALLTARFGTGDGALVLVAVAGGARAAEQGHLAAADACRWIGGAVARSHARLSDDIRAGRRGDLKSGLHRLTDRTYGKLRARAAELGLEPSAYTAGLRCLLLSADPDCRTRVFFGVGGGGLFRLRDGSWQDLEPLVPTPAERREQEEGPGGDRLTMDLQITTPPSPYPGDPAPPPAEPFRFRASVARPGDVLLLCGNGLAEPVRGAPELAGELARRWAAGDPPGLPAYLADVQLRVKGYADDRTAAAVWEA